MLFLIIAFLYMLGAWLAVYGFNGTVLWVLIIIAVIEGFIEIMS